MTSEKLDTPTKKSDYLSSALRQLERQVKKAFEKLNTKGKESSDGDDDEVEGRETDPEAMMEKTLALKADANI